MKRVFLKENVLHAKERETLNEEDFGLPKKRKFPLVDKIHIQKAIQLFKNCEEDDRKELAKNISIAAKKFNVHISDDSEVAKYL